MDQKCCITNNDCNTEKGEYILDNIPNLLDIRVLIEL